MDDRLAKISDAGAERAVLGAMMMREQTAVEVYDVLTSSDFFDAKHAFTFDAIVKRMLDAEPVDPIAVADRLAREDLLDKVGGAPFLFELVEQAIPASVMFHAKIIKELSRRRQLAVTLVRNYQRALSLETDLDTTIDSVQAEVHSCTSVTAVERTGPVFIGSEIDQVVAARLDPKAHPVERGLGTGLVDLDTLTGGLRRGQLIVVGGRPGDGKSLLLTGFARHAAIKQNANTLLISLEMRREEIYDRVLAAEAKVLLHRLVSRSTPPPDERHRLAAAAERIKGAPLAIDDNSTVDINRIRALARMHQVRHGLDLLLLDYVQLVSPTSPREPRTQQIDGITRGLKLLAGELNVPVVAAAQLNRQADSRPDRMPQLSDLRESGGLENDANIVILLHRDDRLDPESPRAGEIDLVVAKNRNGPTDTLTAAAQFHFARIQDMAVA